MILPTVLYARSLMSHSEVITLQVNIESCHTSYNVVHIGLSIFQGADRMVTSSRSLLPLPYFILYVCSRLIRMSVP
jgi:hypothetical protein